MFKLNKPQKTTLRVNETTTGEPIEHKINRILNNGEPITDGAPITYTERKDGVLPEYDIRTDRFEIATDAMDKVTKDKLAKREQRETAREAGKIVNMGKLTNDDKTEPGGTGTEGKQE